MRITLNGSAMQLDDSPTIAEVLLRTGYAGCRVAVELNRAIVPRSRHEEQRVADGDTLEIVHAMGGG